MQVRNAIVAVTVAAFALTLSACTQDADPTPTASGTANAPVTTPSDSAEPSPSATPTTSPAAAGDIRPIQDGFTLTNVTETLRTGFPSFAEKTDDEIVVILNAGCDGIDAEGTPQAGADAIQSHGIDAYDAMFAVTASISLYCPEYSAFLGPTS
ncbi:hypothetical protein [Demequina sp.]|uniref:hypothetical protein n=1 Tax=Demequina sp. TaxID=2050685 RepID=UPI003D0D658A